MSSTQSKTMAAKSVEGKSEAINPSEKARRGKVSEQAKYTDVKRTSSASFKPPMSKDHIVNTPIQPPQRESGWFSPFSYIKTMFGSKQVTNSTSSTDDRSSKSDRLNNASQNLKTNLKDVSKYSKWSMKDSDSDKTTTEKAYGMGTEAKEGNASATVINSNDINRPKPKSPSFSISPKNAITKRETNSKTYSSGHGMFDQDEDIDPTVPKYNAIQSVDNHSTYLHAPDKKGTTSFRITTAPKVGLKQVPTLLSPSFSNQSQQKRPIKMNRKGSTSPHKTRNDIGSARLRSKSTPDSSSIKSRPVSVAAIPKSHCLKIQKIVPSNSEVKEIGPVVTNAKNTKKPVSYNANKVREYISMSHPKNKIKRQMSPISINHTSTNAYAATKSIQPAEASSYSSVQNISCSNNSKLKPIRASPKLTNNRLTLNKKGSTTSIESPTFTVPSMPRLEKSAIEKYHDSMLLRKMKMKGKSHSALTRDSQALHDTLSIISAVQQQAIERNKSPPSLQMPMDRKYDSTGEYHESHQTLAKTVTLCKAKANVVDYDSSHTGDGSKTNLQQGRLRTLQLNHNADRKSDKSVNDSEPRDSTNCTQKNTSVRMTNSSQHHPKHPTKAQVGNLLNRKTSSFTNLLVAERKDQQHERETSGELINSSYNTSTKKENQNDNISIPTQVIDVENDDFMLTAPSFYDTCNSASDHLCAILNKECDSPTDYDIDNFICDDSLVYQNTCNSAHRGDVIKYCKGCWNSPMDNADDEILCDTNYAPPINSRRSITRKISNNSTSLREDKMVSECSISDESRLAKGKRKYPFDLEYEKNHKRDFHSVPRLPSPKLLKKTPSFPKQTVNVSYQKGGKTSYSSQSKRSSTLKFLQQNVRVDTPTLLEPSTVVKPIMFSSPSSYTPTNNLNSFASSVGDAIGAITSAFQSSFMNMVSPTCKNNPTGSHLNRNSPKRPEIHATSSSPTRSVPTKSNNQQSKIVDCGPTKIVEKPMSATRSFVSSVLEEKGISKSVENGINTLKGLIEEGRGIYTSPTKKNVIKQNVKKDSDKKASDDKNMSIKINDESPAIEKKNTTSADNILDDRKIIKHQFPENRRRMHLVERDNKRSNSSHPAAVDEKNLSNDKESSDNSFLKKKSNQNETNNLKLQTPIPILEPFTNSKNSDVVKKDKNVADELKPPTVDAPEKTTTESAHVKKKSTELGDNDLDKTGKNIFAPLIVTKKPDSVDKNADTPAVKKSKKKRSRDPDFFSSNKSHLGEL